MCKPGNLDVDVSPESSVDTIGNNSSAVTEQLKNSISNHIDITVTGSIVFVLALLIVFVVLFMIYRLQKMHYNIHHTRYANLASHINYPGSPLRTSEEDGKEDLV